jgi:uncharacterized protein YndB with AHSA1/START domain
MQAVERSVEVPAPAQDVWEQVVGGDWLGDEAQIDPRPGGDGFVLDRGEVRHVVVEQVDAPQRLVYRWWPLTPDGVGTASRVVIDVQPGQEHTRVVVTEAPLTVPAPLPSPGPMALAALAR